MLIDLGVVRPGSTIRIPFSTFDKDDGSSITMTSFAAADLLVYKDGGTTERGSTSGYTATTDFDSKTGKHIGIIDLADNTTSGFFTAGSECLIAIDAVTVDGVTVGGWLARLKIGYPGALIDTTIASLTSQQQFTLTNGPAEDNAIVGRRVIIHDIASAVQLSEGIIVAYTGSTKTCYLLLPPTFTIAAGDNISIMDVVLGPAQGVLEMGVAQATASDGSTLTMRSGASFGDNTLAGIMVAIGSDQGYAQSTNIASNVGSTDVVTLDPPFVVRPTSIVTYYVIAGTKAPVTVANIPKANLAAVLGTAITEGASGRLAAALTAFLNVATPVLTVASVNQTGDVHATTTNGTYGLSALQTLLVVIAGYIDTEVGAIKAKTDTLPSDPADASDIAASFSTVNSTLATIASYIDTEVAAIKAKTDNLPSGAMNTYTMTQILTALSYLILGVSDAAGTSYKKQDGTTAGIDYTLDGSNNRTGVTLH